MALQRLKKMKEDGNETGQRQTPHDVRRPKFGFPV
jgi:hypothetical protein